MKQRNKKQFVPEFKARVALEALQDKESLAQLRGQCGVHPVLVGPGRSSSWRRRPRPSSCKPQGVTPRRCRTNCCGKSAS